MTRDWIDDLGKEVTGMGKTRRAQATAAMQQDPVGVAETADLLLADMAGEWVRHKQRRRVWTWLFRIAVLLLLLAIAASLVKQWLPTPGDSVDPYTVTISLNGPVFEGAVASAESLRWRLEKAMKDDNAAGVLLLIDSPGGSPVQAGLMYDNIKAMRAAYPEKPVHALVGNLAASAGYYIAAAADNIYANKASLVGSIGVRLDSFGAVDALEHLGLERRLLTAGAHKGFLDPFLPVDEKAQAHMRGVLNSVHQQFITAVEEGRGERLKDHPDLYTGLIWSGEQAMQLGLVDGLMDAHKIASEVFATEDLMPIDEEESLLDELMQKLGMSIANALRPRTWLQ